MLERGIGEDESINTSTQGMKSLKLKIEIPQSLNDITLGQYQEYLKVLEANKEDDNAGDFLNLKALSIFCGIDLKESYKIPVKHFYFALEHLEKCFKEDTPLVKEFVFKDINGVEQPMGFIPKLDDMTIGEYVDLDKYITDWQQMHKAMAVLYRPIRVKHKESYVIDEYNGTEAYGDAMKETPVGIAIGALIFFYRLGIDLSRAMTNYLEEGKESRLVQYLSSDKNGDGINQYTHLLKGILDDLNISLN